MTKKTYTAPHTSAIVLPELCVDFQEQGSQQNEIDFAKRHQAIDEEYDGGDDTSTNVWEDE